MIRIKWNGKKIEIRRLYTVHRGIATEIKDYESELGLSIIDIEGLFRISRALGRGIPDFRNPLEGKTGYGSLFIWRSSESDLTGPDVKGWTPYGYDISKVKMP